MSIRDPDLFASLIRKISDSIFELIKKLNLDPNKITGYSFIIFVPLIFMSLLNNGMIYNTISFVLLSIYTIIDMLDGNFARNQNKESEYGKEIDANLDYLYLLIVMVALSINSFYFFESKIIVFMCFISIIFQSINSYFGLSFKYKYSVNEYSGKKNIKKEKLSFSQQVLLNIVSPNRLPYSSFFTLRYYLFLGIIFNLKPFILIPFALFSFIRSIILFFVYHWLLKKDNANSELYKAFIDD